TGHFSGSERVQRRSDVASTLHGPPYGRSPKVVEGEIGPSVRPSASLPGRGTVWFEGQVARPPRTRDRAPSSRHGDRHRWPPARPPTPARTRPRATRSTENAR